MYIYNITVYFNRFRGELSRASLMEAFKPLTYYSVGSGDLVESDRISVIHNGHKMLVNLIYRESCECVFFAKLQG